MTGRVPPYKKRHFLILWERQQRLSHLTTSICRDKTCFPWESKFRQLLFTKLSWRPFIKRGVDALFPSFAVMADFDAHGPHWLLLLFFSVCSIRSIHMGNGSLQTQNTCLDSHSWRVWSGTTAYDHCGSIMCRRPTPR